jgi:hypothetical protein
MLVAISVLALLAAFMGQLLNSSSALVATNDKHMDADAQARGTLDRIAVDLGQMVKRADASTYLKDPLASPAVTQTGNDQLAFFSQVPGYFSTTSAQSPVSLVAYRINSTTMGMERMGKGLVWYDSTGTNSPLFLPKTILNVWPQATNQTADTINYESIAPGVFRFEYYYLLKGQIGPDGVSHAAALSASPYDTRITGHNSVNGFCDVAAICVALAVVDPASRNLVNNAQLTTLAGQMNDFSATTYGSPGLLETQWNSAIAASSLPKIASSSIRVYGRMLYLSPSIQ